MSCCATRWPQCYGPERQGDELFLGMESIPEGRGAPALWTPLILSGNVE
jgi:hypothetical protein